MIVLMLAVVLQASAQEEKAGKDDLRTAFHLLVEELCSNDLEVRDRAQRVLNQKATDDSTASTLVPLLEEALNEEKDVEWIGH